MVLRVHQENTKGHIWRFNMCFSVEKRTFLSEKMSPKGLWEFLPGWCHTLQYVAVATVLPALFIGRFDQMPSTIRKCVAALQHEEEIDRGYQRQRNNAGLLQDRTTGA